MQTNLFATGLILTSILLLASCVSPEASALAESQRQAVEADIDDILSYAVDATEVGETKRCLSDSEYRNFRALGDRHLLFEGRRDKQWVNVLRTRCSGLEDGDFFVVEPTSGRRMCISDHFTVGNRHLMTSRIDLGTGSKCVLGKFKPVTRAQVEEIEKRLESL